MASVTRETVALSEPPADLDGFPRVDTAGRQWFRAHAAVNGPWWFSHDGSGRFDLEQPHGTCYLAGAVAVAMRERFGETLTRAGVVAGAAADQAMVSALPVAATVADTTSPASADYGVTRELGTVVPYSLPRRWAAAFNRAKLQGIQYWPRFSVGGDAKALALFGSAGADDARPTDPSPMSGREAARLAGIAVFDPPRSVPITDPPSRA